MTHDEVRPILQDWKKVRENDGKVEVLQCTSDNPRTDRNEVETVFPGILKNVKPYILTSGSLLTKFKIIIKPYSIARSF
jgi:hypothetical protein